MVVPSTTEVGMSTRGLTDGNDLLLSSGYRFDNDEWLGERGTRTKSSDGEWPVSYHGTGESATGSIAQDGYQLSNSCTGLEYTLLHQLQWQKSMQYHLITKGKSTSWCFKIVDWRILGNTPSRVNPFLWYLHKKTCYHNQIISMYIYVCVCVCACMRNGRSPEVIRPPGKCYFFLWGMATVGQREGAQ